MFNIGVTSTNANFEPLVRYYSQNINPDFKMATALKELMEKIKVFIKIRKADGEKN
jgi:hypothetical protein